MISLTDEQIVWILMGLSLVCFLLAMTVITQQVKLRRILKGKTGGDLEDSFKAIEKEYQEMRKFRHSINQYLETVEKRLNRSIQAVSTLRFNPWKGSGEGGNQSFATAFVSEKGDGLVLSSLSVRDRISVFAKPLEKGKTSYELSNEEKTVMEKAISRVRE
ncbi:MAG: DUF4446 family protein [Candidatus Taylorbacteria bacterium]|nr:DUF4446 family protein [Candidatus Taylorbacteria bacterium]